MGRRKAKVWKTCPRCSAGAHSGRHTHKAPEEDPPDDWPYFCPFCPHCRKILKKLENGLKDLDYSSPGYYPVPPPRAPGVDASTDTNDLGSHVDPSPVVSDFSADPSPVASPEVQREDSQRLVYSPPPLVIHVDNFADDVPVGGHVDDDVQVDVEEVYVPREFFHPLEDHFMDVSDIASEPEVADVPMIVSDFSSDVSSVSSLASDDAVGEPVEDDDGVFNVAFVDSPEAAEDVPMNVSDFSSVSSLAFDAAVEEPVEADDGVLNVAFLDSLERPHSDSLSPRRRSASIDSPRGVIEIDRFGKCRPDCNCCNPNCPCSFFNKCICTRRGCHRSAYKTSESSTDSSSSESSAETRPAQKRGRKRKPLPKKDSSTQSEESTLAQHSQIGLLSHKTIATTTTTTEVTMQSQASTQRPQRTKRKRATYVEMAEEDIRPAKRLTEENVVSLMGVSGWSNEPDGTPVNREIKRLGRWKKAPPVTGPLVGLRRSRRLADRRCLSVSEQQTSAKMSEAEHDPNGEMCVDRS